MKLTVLVPTYRRPSDLARCLSALQQQIRPANEVLVTVRDIDTDTWAFLETFNPGSLPLKVLTVTVPGVVAAMNLGFETATGNVISVTDDDAAPHPDWLQRIEAHFLADDRLGGLGGRDWMYVNGKLQDANTQPGASNIVGRVQWFGRMVGNHHIGEGESREIDLLKGVNMSLRKTAIEGLSCDERMKGTGAQVHFEVALSLSIKRKGWKLIYDPIVAVDHYPAQRFDEDQRDAFNAIAWANKAHNETIGLLDHLSWPQKIIYLTWAFLIGTRDTFGILQLLRFLPKERSLSYKKWQASIQGRWQAWQTWQHAQSKKRAKFIKQSNILIMTATITPPAGVPYLKRTDPAARLLDYQNSLKFYLSHLDQCISSIVFAENSISDVSSLKEIVRLNKLEKKVEFLSFNGLDYPPQHGRAYGEFKLLDYVMSNSETIRSKDSEATVWKVTGRYIIRNFHEIVIRRPLNFDIYCNLRKIPKPWADMFLLGWSHEGYENFLKGIYLKLKTNYDSAEVHPEEMFVQLLNNSKKMKIAKRFSEAPQIDGIRGSDNQGYLEGSNRIKFYLRTFAQKLFPWLWI